MHYRYLVVKRCLQHGNNTTGLNQLDEKLRSMTSLAEDIAVLLLDLWHHKKGRAVLHVKVVLPQNYH